MIPVSGTKDHDGGGILENGFILGIPDVFQDNGFDGQTRLVQPFSKNHITRPMFVFHPTVTGLT